MNAYAELVKLTNGDPDWKIFETLDGVREGELSYATACDRLGIGRENSDLIEALS